MVGSCNFIGVITNLKNTICQRDYRIQSFIVFGMYKAIFVSIYE